MRFYANPTPGGLTAFTTGRLGFIDTPAQGRRRPDGVDWCADNGCFGTGWPGEDRWLQWLGRNRHDAARCAFATAPDVVGDAPATLARSLPTLPLIRALGYPAALVAQDGLTPSRTPWQEFDVLFIGGSTAWKLGPDARRLITAARDRDHPVHMGRVNSHRRMRYAQAIGCTSCDGTYLIYGPDRNLPRLLRWVAEVTDQTTIEIPA